MWSFLDHICEIVPICLDGSLLSGLSCQKCMSVVFVFGSYFSVHKQKVTFILIVLFRPEWTLADTW